MFEVTLQIPIKVYDGSIRLFRRPKTLFQTPPHPAQLLPGPGGQQIVAAYGTLLCGCNLPTVLPSEHGAKTAVMEVGEDLDTGECFVTLLGCYQGTYTAEEYLKQLGTGWELGHTVKGPQTDAELDLDEEPPDDDAGPFSAN